MRKSFSFHQSASHSHDVKDNGTSIPIAKAFKGNRTEIISPDSHPREKALGPQLFPETWIYLMKSGTNPVG